ncbi:MAG: ABC transporter ATP-binding protein [Bacteroidaceae bacterium]|nr:ABC transporter ATP-binding protein [Bacteroidaceae bacterium]
MQQQKSIEINDLCTGYVVDNKKKIISDKLTARIFPYELTCLLGPNGAGKSTLLRTLAGFQPALGGSITIGGDNIKSFKSKDLAKLISVVLTDNAGIKNMTAYDVVAMGRAPYTGFWGKLREQDKKTIDKSFEWVNIVELKERKMQTLSDGERQKVMIAKAIAQETPIIFMDEPTAFLDYPSKIQMMLLLHRLAKSLKKTIFLSTHDLEHALQVADHIWLLDKENGLTTGSPEDLSALGMIEKYFNRDGITYDRNLCTFNIEHETSREVVVNGDKHSLEYKLCCKALIRNGIKPVDDRNDVVKLLVPGDGTFRLIERGTEIYNVDRIEHLLVTVVPTIVKNQISEIREAANMTQFE